MALAGIMHETAVRFEETSSRVAQLVLGDAEDEGRDLISTLQDFDRLRQELAAISDVLSGCVGDQEEAIRHDPEAGVRALVDSVPVADLRRRLLARLGIQSLPQEVLPDQEF
ncbi:MAG: hypothetical protein IT537_24695 [Hyphomicrobiales bacterium]|nr:hypothetical protein [Hyphomicrobiales bacterium]